MTGHQTLNSRPFAFDTEFDGAGGVVRASSFRPAKRAYMPAEVDALVSQARLESRQDALNEADSLLAMALNAIAQAVIGSAPALAAVAQAHREQAADLALSAARVIASGALERCPAAPIEAALEALGSEIDASPRLVIRASGLSDEVRARLQSVCADAGFTGLCSFRDEPGLPLAAFQLEWADGRADYDPAEAAARITEAVSAALASEAGHAEAINGAV